MTEACYNLVYFELAACRLTSLPANFSSLVPNVRVLNLNYNFLEDVGPLDGLNRMKKLSIIGSRVKGTKGLIRIVQRMGEIEMVDFRYEIPFWGKGAEGTDISFGDEDVSSRPCEFPSGRDDMADGYATGVPRCRVDQMCWREG